MKQIIQSYKTGELMVMEVPPPALRSGCVLVRNVVSLVSVGTEKHILDMAKKSLIGKALARPDLVRQVIAKAKTEGVLEAYRQAMNRLDTPVPLGYSSAGVVIDVGEGVEGFAKGDRVACAGSGFASHAEIICVPQNFCVKIPNGVDFESASFVALGGIALQAVRLANVSLGSKVMVIGLGLLGQLTVQLLKAAGCHVFGVDTVPAKVKMALEHGAEDGAVIGKTDIKAALSKFAPQGADAVIIMAATRSNEPLELAAEVARERAKIIAAGLVGLKIPREIFFEKELELVVSRAWGPGVFDPTYVEKNIDYPYAYVRWTAKRNLEEFLAQVAKGAVEVKHLITHRFPIERATDAYDLILKGKEPYIGVLITYSEAEKTLYTPEERRLRLRSPQEKSASQKSKPIGIGIIGAGLFATTTFLPVLKRQKNIKLRGIATTTSHTGYYVGKKFGFEYCTTNYKELLNDPEIDLVMILTRHGSHAHFIVEALRAGKHVYVEKPLAVNEEQLRTIVEAYREIQEKEERILFVGFNRRFSPLTRWLKDRLQEVKEPLTVHCTINAGPVPPDHWVHDREQGGGRIIGEVCHFVDLIQYLTDSVPLRIYAETLESEIYKPSDNVVITLKMANGSIGSITYVSGGDKSFPRERIEVFGGGAVGVIENFKTVTFIYHGQKKRIRRWFGVDRGHQNELNVLFNAIMKGEAPVNFEEYVYTTLATFAAERALFEKVPISVDVKKFLL